MTSQAPRDNTEWILERFAKNEIPALWDAYAEMVSILIDLPRARKTVSPHPAIHLIELCEFAAQVHRDGDVALLRETDWASLTDAALSAFAVGIASSGDSTKPDVSKLANYGDCQVQRRIQGIAKDPRQFGDLMTELRFAAMNVVRGNSVTAFERDNYPDFRVDSSALALPLFVDCKRLRQASSLRAVVKDIKDTNRKLKTVGTTFHGMAVVDISAQVHHAGSLSGTSPPGLSFPELQAASAIRSFNRSVSGVLLVWSYHGLTDSPSGLVRIRSMGHRSKLLRHLNPVHSLPPDGPWSNFGLGMITVGKRIAPVDDRTWWATQHGSSVIMGRNPLDPHIMEYSQFWT